MLNSELQYSSQNSFDIIITKTPNFMQILDHHFHQIAATLWQVKYYFTIVKKINKK